MTSYDTNDVIWGIVDDLTRNTKTSVNIYKFLQKNQKTFVIVQVVAK